MPKYYTQCLGTPSIPGRRDEYRYVYGDASAGYLFHDTEGLADFRDVHRCMWKLAALYENASGVHAVRVNDKTIFASFNTVSIIKPIRIERYVRGEEVSEEWITKNRPKGWLVENIRDTAQAPLSIDYNVLYDECLQLERSMGECPCPRITTTCKSLTLGRVMPKLLDRLADYGQVKASVHHTQSYANIGGFEYTSSMYTIDAAFVESIRPWDNYDFSLVPARKKEFKERGEDVAQRNRYRKEHCEKCIFHRKKYGGRSGVRDCGSITTCQGEATDALAEAAVWRWLKHCTPYLEDAEGFTKEEIRFLIYHAGLTARSSCTSEKTIDVRLAGFQSSFSGNVRYRVVAERGQLNRHMDFSDYRDLRAAIPLLPAPERIPEVALNDIYILFHAIASTQRGQRYRRGSFYEFYGIQQHKNDYATLMLHHGNKKYEGLTFNFRTPFGTLYELLWPGEQTEIFSKLRCDPLALYPRVAWRYAND